MEMNEIEKKLGKVVPYDMIYLGPDEWGNEMMQRVAAEWFAAHSECQFVLVYEHAGWYLGFRRDGSYWDTANGYAVMDKRERPTRYSGVEVRRE